MSNENTIIGIDLGTTFSGVSVVQEGRPVMLPNKQERIMPSVVGLSPQGEWLVGTPALNQWVLAPEATVRSIKRDMGTDRTVTLGEHSFTPQEISAFILRELKRVAEVNLGYQVKRAVITVPAYFPDAARQATKDAGQIAGLEVMRIINEPTAAALAYGLDREEDQVVLVYDLGGGTFDVSLVELVSGVVEVWASHGNTRLGGDDFDALLAEHLRQAFEKQHSVDLRNDRRAMARLTRAAEKAKVELSSHPFAWVREEYLVEKQGKPLHLELEVSRHEFEAMIADLIGSTRTSIQQSLTDAKMTIKDLDKVLLVGGSTYIPAVWELAANATGLDPRQEVHPSEAVALGAGIQAAIIAGQPIEAILVDVTPHSLGIEVAEWTWRGFVNDRYNTIIYRNTTIPVTKERVYSTLYPDQDTVHLKVYQGEHPIASKNTLLGDFTFTDLKPEQKGELARVTVEFSLDVNGILHVKASDRGSGQETGIEVAASKERLTQEQISQAQERLAEAAPTLVLDEGNQAMVDRARELLQSGELEPEDSQDLTEALTMIDEACRLGDEDELDNWMDELTDLLYELEE
ncbi:MAG: Hsp70 family protein [Anaerolineae bacterium]|nr:Hsp70 family protein [Anaerolineae bacterium]